MHEEAEGWQASCAIILLLSFRQSLSPNLELGWQSARPRDSPASASQNWDYRHMEGHAQVYVSAVG